MLAYQGWFSFEKLESDTKPMEAKGGLSTDFNGTIITVGPVGYALVENEGDIFIIVYEYHIHPSLPV